MTKKRKVHKRIRNIFVKIQSTRLSETEEQILNSVACPCPGSQKNVHGWFIKIRVTCRTWTAISCWSIEGFYREDDDVDSVRVLIMWFWTQTKYYAYWAFSSSHGGGAAFVCTLNGWKTVHFWNDTHYHKYFLHQWTRFSGVQKVL